MIIYRSKKRNYKNGQLMLLIAVFFTTFTITICLGFINPIIEQTKITGHYWNTKFNYYLSEAGIDDLIYRFKNEVPLDGAENLLINGYKVLIYSSGDEGRKVLTSEFGLDLVSRKLRVEVQKAGPNKFQIIDWGEI